MCCVLVPRIRTYEHEASWGKALTSYDLHANLPEVTRQVGIVEVRRVLPLQTPMHCSLDTPRCIYPMVYTRYSLEPKAFPPFVSSYWVVRLCRTLV